MQDHTVRLHRTSSWLWVGAGLAAIGIHAGAVAAVLLQPPAPDATDDVGAPATAIAIELASPRIEQSDLPPGPESEAAAASVAATEATPAAEQTQLARETPTPDVEEPDRVVSLNEAETLKDEEKPEPTPQQVSPSQESAAAEATAPPVVETAREAPTTTAPVIGNGATASRERATWQRQLVAHLDRSKRYPGAARAASSQVVVSFTLDRRGRVVSSQVVTGSGDPAFDEAALAMMRRADPVPAPPPLVADEGLTFTVPVVFRNKGRG